MPLTVANNCLGVDPHARRESCSNLATFFMSKAPSSDSVHDCQSIRESRLDRIGQVKFIPDIGRPEQCQDLFPRCFSSAANIACCGPCSRFCSSKSNLFPAIRRNCQNMRSRLATENPISGNVCLQVSHAFDDQPRGNTIAQNLWSFFSCLQSSCQSAAHMYFMISSMHRFMFCTLIFPTPNPRLQSKHWLPQLQMPWPCRSSEVL